MAFDSTEEDLEKALSQFGPIEEIQIPKKEDGKSKGFAFVQFIKESCAQQAIEGFNGKKIRNRAVAIDWALQQKDFLSAKKKLESNNQNEEKKENRKRKSPTNEEEEEGEGDREEEGQSEEMEEEEDLGEEDRGEEDRGEEESEEKKEEKQEERKKTREEDCKDGKTLFVRNLAFTSTEESLKERFKEFGELEYVKIVVSRETKLSKGCAFVRFKKRESVEEILRKYEKNVINSNKEKNSLSELYDDENCLMVEGRAIYIQVALPTSSINKMKEEKNKEIKVKQQSLKDPQNLHLLEEGKIEENTRAAIGFFFQISHQKTLKTYFFKSRCIRKRDGDEEEDLSRE